MPTAYVVIEGDGKRTRVGSRLVIGRTKECDVPIGDSSASRRHMQIERSENRFLWKDLDSTNGTLVNGNRMLAGELKNGDVIQIGETKLLFEVEAGQDAQNVPAAQRPPVSGAAGKPLDPDDSTLFRETVFDLEGTERPALERDKTQELLEAVYAVVNDIAMNYDPAALIDRVLQTLVRAIDAQRAAVFVLDDGGNLGPLPQTGQVHCIQDGVLRPAAPDEIAISQTVASRVIEGGESVLYQDTDTGGLDISQSIMSLQLRSILCVPLRAKDRIIGILYADTNRENQQYTRDHMLLAAAVGNSAGLALENAQMHSAMLEKQRIEHEIATAWTIQEGFLVKDWPEENPHFEVYGETRPAKTVGGDFYDFVRTGEYKAGILIGDVSGKGVPASLTMAQLIAEFRLQAERYDSPAAVLSELNVSLAARSQFGLFCTVCYITFDLRNGEMVLANAGHHPALCFGTERMDCLGPASGPPVGILPDATWQDETGRLAPGETVLLYTDGIVEARTMVTHVPGAQQGSDELGVDGLQQFIQFKLESAPKPLIEGINEEVLRFCSPQRPHDDCTMVALRYLGPMG